IVQMVHVVPPSLRGDASLPRGRAQQLVESLSTRGPTELSKLAKEFGSARSIVKRLAELGFVTVQRSVQELDPFLHGDVTRDTPPTLNLAQKNAVNSITTALKSAGGAQF